MRRKARKILFAPVDTNFRMEVYSKFINEYYSDHLAPDTLTIYVLPEQHYKTSYTYKFHYHKRSSAYRWFRSILNFTFFLFKYDVFHFISGETLLTRRLRRLELKIYKLFGKRVIMHFVGSDIRDPGYVYWKEKNIYQYLRGEDKMLKSLPWQKELIKDIEEYADEILVSTPDLLQLVPKAHYYPVVLDLEKYLSELDNIQIREKNNKEVVILHSPSSIVKSQLKGTDHIVKVLKKLEQDPRYNIRLVLPFEQEKSRETNYSATRYELFKHFKEADIIIDQLIIGWYGLLTIEALAAEKQVISYVDEQLRKYLYPDCPINIADVNTLEEVLVKCIENHLNNRVNNDQLEWVRKYHTIENNNTNLIQAWGLKKSV
ncbi:MAG: hypothetical protein K0S44_1004 [Bacteroidetes bacterium]|jgi:hypothetical protein|nr:hypothetical protein [Bacteroidota bacterium]